ncbi:MAG: hypothetical protein V2J55_07865 [Candidatus Competibacteraceae bacterium]|jgi:predicted amidohydrolase|nr:hypothetical protein [Candidatus Competibacteraceae bacterium]
MAAQDMQNELVISNGRVIDPETGLDAVRNVGINNGKIFATTDQPVAIKETIDAICLVGAPGFVDGHSHSANDAFGLKMGILDGRTTQMDLEAGAWPVDVWYDHLERRSQVNYGASVGHLPIRDIVFSNITMTTGNLFLEMWKSKSQWPVHQASPEELEKHCLP